MDKTLRQNRINKVIEAIMKVARGDYSVQIELSGENDSLDSLAMGFNIMVEDLSKTTVSLDILNAANQKLQASQQQLKVMNQQFRELAMIVEQTEEGVALSDLEGKLRFVNTAYAKMHGYGTRDELIGKNLSIFHTEEQMKTEVISFNDKVKRAGNSRGEMWHIRKDGTVFPTDMSVTLFKDESGKPVGLIAITSDISSRKKSEEKIKIFSSAVENAYDSFVLTDMNGNVTYANKSCIKNFGYSLDEITKLNVSQFTANPEDAKNIIEELKKKGSWKGELIQARKNKEEFPAMLTTSLVRDDKGNPTAMMGIFRDITDNKLAEEELKESEGKFRAIFDNANDGILLSDVETRKFYTGNNTACQMLGYSLEEIKKLGVTDIHPKEDLPYVIEQFGRQVRKEIIVAKDLPVKRKDGSVFYVDINSSSITLAGRTYLIGIFRDITERQQKEKELEKVHKELVSASHRAGMAEVAADVLHNVGNVLNSINVSANFIKDWVLNSKVTNLKKVIDMISEHEDDLGTFLTEDQRGKHIPVYLAEAAKLMLDEQADITEKIQSLMKNVEHIKQIIKAQQGYARASGVDTLTSIKEVIEDAVEINSAGLKRHAVDLKMELVELPKMHLDKQRVLQILVNLTTNGKHALSKNEIQEKLLTIRCYQHGNDRLRIDVADNGVGVSKENMPMMFKHGFTTRERGHGFGLHSSALAAKEMGGSLTVHSDGPEHGATFTIELPLKSEEVIKCTQKIMKKTDAS